MLQLYLGDFLGAREHLTEAYANYARRPDDAQQAEGDIGVAALAYISAVLWYLGEPEESLERSDLSLELAERVGGPVTRAQAWGMRSLLHLARSEPTEFGRWIERTRAHSVDHNVGYWRALASLLGGWLQARDGELEAGCRRVDGAFRPICAPGALLGLSRFYVLRAGLCVMAGDHAGAFKDVAGRRGAHRSDRRALRGGRAVPLQGPAAARRRSGRRARRLRARRRGRARGSRRAARAARGDELAELERMSGTRRSRPGASPSCASASRRSRRCRRRPRPRRCSQPGVGAR